MWNGYIEKFIGQKLLSVSYLNVTAWGEEFVWLYLIPFCLTALWSQIRSLLFAPSRSVSLALSPSRGCAKIFTSLSPPSLFLQVWNTLPPSTIRRRILSYVSIFPLLHLKVCNKDPAEPCVLPGGDRGQGWTGRRGWRGNDRHQAVAQDRRRQEAERQETFLFIMETQNILVSLNYKAEEAPSRSAVFNWFCRKIQRQRSDWVLLWPQ